MKLISVKSTIAIFYYLMSVDDTIAEDELQKLDEIGTKTDAENYHNYRDEIRLSVLASIAGLSPSAFSRFFKLHTGKKLSDYIIDIRLGYASRMLVDTNLSISEISYDCGFNNLSNFNRIFKRKKGCTPKAFRSNYQKTRIIL